MPGLKTLSGKQIISILAQFGFRITGQNGSHVKLCRYVPDSVEVLMIPLHKELNRGTSHAIYKQATN
jgi:predicted RNA binding protein YcfA (HicA-like mRNA interferase family)